MNQTMTLDARIRAVFDALGRDDMDDLISHWAGDGIYTNPSLGAPAEGASAVYTTVGRLAQLLKERDEQILIDRITEATGDGMQRAYVEWHIEANGANRERQGKLGLHVVSFNEAGLFHRVTVFAHP